MRRRASLAMTAALALAALWAPAQGQEADEFLTNHNLRGVVPFGSFQFGSVDAVNLGTGAVEVQIPLVERLGRGLDDSRTLTYSSKLWSAELISTGGLAPDTQKMLIKSGREDFSIRAVKGSILWREDQQPCPSHVEDPLNDFPAQLLVRSNFTFETAGGTTVRFPNRVVRNLTPERFCPDVAFALLERGLSDTGTMTLVTPSAQGSDYQILFKDGSRETHFNESFGGSRLTDSNGNFIEGLDTLGRSIVSTGTSTTGRELRYFDSDGTQRTIGLQYIQFNITPSFPSQSCTVGSRTYPVEVQTRPLTALVRINLPNGLSYRFSYDPSFGELTRIDLPTGGYVRYEWTTIANFDNAGVLGACRIDSRRVSRRIVSTDGTAATEQVWTYDYSLNPVSGGFSYETEVVDPAGDRSVHVFDGEGVREQERREYTGLSTLLRTTSNAWGADTGAVASTQSLIGGSLEQFPRDFRNRRLTTTDETWAVTGEMRRTLREYDFYVPAESNLYPSDSRMNVIREFRYDYGQGVVGPLISRTSWIYLHEAKPEYVDQHILDRTYNINLFDSQGNLAARRLLRYDEKALAATSGIVGHDDSGYPASFRLRGLLSKEVTVLVGTATSLVTQHWHDDLGNRVRTRNPRGFDTFFSYDDDYDGALCNIGPTKAFLTQTTNPLGQAERFSHSSCSSLTASSTDANNLRTEYRYDRMDRLNQVLSPDGGEHRRYYSDVDLTASLDGQPVFRQQTSALPLRVRAFTRLEGTQKAERIRVLDGLGRISMQGLRNRSEFDWTRFEYDGVGRRNRLSNPVTIEASTEIPSASRFQRWTQTQFDGIDREITSILPDGSMASVRYEGSFTTPTDVGGRSLRLTRDGLDRLTAVREPHPDTGSLLTGFSDTFYAHNALDNLTQVTQGAQQRSFEYDSASRLEAETHPESGRTDYVYDANGNRTSRTDARGVVTSTQYDQLDRILRTDYSDGTASVVYSYDTGFLGAGLLATVTDEAGASEYHYDEVGRISLLSRTNRAPGGFEVRLNTDYVYDLAGNLRQAQYGGTQPSPGWLLEYGVDEQGRRTSVSGRNLFDNVPIQLVSDYTFRYLTNGAQKVTFFATNGTVEVVDYNERLQPMKRVARLNAFPFTPLMDLSYSFADPQSGINDGNVHEVEDLLDPSALMRYQYDYLNRIRQVEAVNAGWAIGYGYDRYGNRTAQAAFGSPPGFAPFAASFAGNRIVGRSYDAAGNVLFESGRALSWDGESRLAAVDGGVAGRYLYDWQGRRAVKLSPGDERFFFYEATGEVMWEWRIGAPEQDLLRVFHNGRAVFENGSPGGAILHSDHLGTARIKAEVFSPLIRCRDLYSPFGQKHTLPCDSHRVGFTGKERDTETGLDYFGARFYSSIEGRFVSVDPLLDSANPADPQTWSRYAYARNSPLRFVDPNGEDFFDAVGGFGRGVVGGAASAVSGAIDAVSSPIQTAKGIGSAIANPLDTAGAIKASVLQTVSQFREGDDATRGEILGDAVIQIGFAVVGTKGLDKLAKVQSLTRAGRTIQNAANQASRKIGPGKGPVHGTFVHSEFAKLVRLSGGRLSTEVSFLDGSVVPTGTKGSVRVDVVFGPQGQPQAIFDLKTGNAKLTPARIEQIRSNLPEGFNQIPVREVRPDQ